MSTKKTKIVWRLANRPTASEVTDLLKAGLLDKDEAREILFSLETVEERDAKSLQEEIKFLRELVSKLSNNSRTEIIKQIEYIDRPYRKYDWHEPYKFYCDNKTDNKTLGSIVGEQFGIEGSTVMLGASSTTGANYVYDVTNGDFTSIRTF